jgi:hypothetical protein
MLIYEIGCITSLFFSRESAMSIFQRSSYLLLPLLILGSLSGCCEWGCKKPQWLYGKDEPRVPVKVVAMWKDTILYRAEQPQSVRGFGGRLMFYADKSEKPVKVEGTLTVYAFDETHGMKDDPRPTRKYVFTPEQFTLHYSKSEIGHSYSVWLPWDAAANPPCKVSLIARFLPKKGSLVIGEQCLQLLPGPENLTPAPEPPQTSGTLRSVNPVRPVSHEVEVPDRLDSAAPAGATQAPGLRSITIPVPLQSRMYSSSAAYSPGMSAGRPMTLPATARLSAAGGMPAAQGAPAAWATNPVGSDCPVTGRVGVRRAPHRRPIPASPRRRPGHVQLVTNRPDPGFKARHLFRQGTIVLRLHFTLKNSS